MRSTAKNKHKVQTTMTNTKESIKVDIKAYIQNNGGAYSDWYVGIASDPKERLFTDHNVSEKGGAWIYREAESSSAAREVEEYFINTLGTDGGSGGGDYSTKSVYAYKKTSTTKE
ncbi:MAG: hypothetical protein COV70_00475 [Parcubacteria group bacterium CG11_big_fil_rev_8_21_14_0_20_39_22]|nr:MAG: hypothetical protein COV70_00475 [Parcubacteria group bacterium CG11_big_fil_rev_8_21_14_0_20_39_22]